MVRSFLNVEGLRPRLVLAVLAMLARLGDLDRELGWLSSFAADDAVDAVAEVGRRAGRVGDFGRSFVIGEIEFVFLIDLVSDAVKACFVLDPEGTPEVVDAKEDRPAVPTAAFLCSLAVFPYDSGFGTDCLGVAFFEGSCLSILLAVCVDNRVMGALLEVPFEVAAEPADASRAFSFVEAMDGTGRVGFDVATGTWLVSVVSSLCPLTIASADNVTSLEDDDGP